MFADHLLLQSTPPDLSAHAGLGPVVLAEKHFPLLLTASSLLSRETSVSAGHGMMQLKLISITLEDDRASSFAMEVVCSWCGPCCLCGNFEFEEAICVHKQ